jgi:hypothetical protein
MNEWYTRFEIPGKMELVVETQTMLVTYSFKREDRSNIVHIMIAQAGSRNTNEGNEGRSQAR